MSISGRYIIIKISKGIKYIIFATNILFILLLLLSTQAPSIAPSQSILITFLGLGFSILLILNMLYVLFWLLTLQWKYIIVNLLALALCWPAIYTYISFESREAVLSEEDRISFMSYNVRGFNWLKGEEARENPILEYIANSGADIICLQEFAIEEKKQKNKLLSLSEFDDIMENYPYRNIIRLGETGSTIYGLACYSKYPILKVARVPVQSAFLNGCAMYEIKVGKKSVTVVNIHLESNRITEEDKELYHELIVKQNRKVLDEFASTMNQRLGSAFRFREVQADVIADCIKQQREKTDAMIVCGDFNAPPISYSYEKIKGNFVDAFQASGKGIGITYHADGFLFRIDYILHTKNMKSYNFTVGSVKYSDHYPIWADLFIRYI